METSYHIGKNTIPVELRFLYEEVSEDFEQKVFGALKSKKEKRNEKARRVFKKLSAKREIYAAVPGRAEVARH